MTAKARGLERVAPFLHRPSAQMARIAEAFESVDEIADGAFRHHVVDDRANAVRLQHAVHFAEEFRDRVEVMRRNAAGDEIERAVLERQRLGLGVGDADIAEAALGGFRFHLVEHFLGDVGRPHALDMRRKGVGDMAAAGGDVERAPGLLRLREIDEALQTFAERVRCRGEVARGGLAEVFLDERFIHWVFPPVLKVRAYIAQTPEKSPASQRDSSRQ